MIWYTFRVESMVRTVVHENLYAYQTAAALELSLINQKGYVSYYVIDKNPSWLRQLGEWRQRFKERLSQVITQEKDPAGAAILRQIDTQYRDYVANKDEVLSRYTDDDYATAGSMHQKIREEFFTILSLCEAYKEHQDKKIRLANQKNEIENSRLRKITLVALAVQVAAGVFLGLVLIGQVLEPLKILMEKTRRGTHDDVSRNLVKALSHNVENLLRDAGETHQELEKSRENLIMAEKLAMVGKLAAGMAHSVRNPLTSVKMRLFSLNRSLKLDEDQAEDLMVISEEISHIDTIVQNFLEFSRPPRLQMQIVSPSTVVDMMLQLLTHRLKSYEVTVRLERDGWLPDVKGDPEQLKEVFVNLVENACQAMVRGGVITISERLTVGDDGRSMCAVQIRDTGPGMTPHALEKAFHPFFTTKEDGTGLGLSIAERIIQNHGGRVSVESRPGEGAAFTILLPTAADKDREA